MELALNLCWLLVMALLCGACLVARRRGQLRVSFGAALGCSVLLAMVLFPAISMTDDLQHLNLEAETRMRSLCTMLSSTVAVPAELVPALAFAFLLVTALAMLVRLLARLATLGTAYDRRPQRMAWYRPGAIRPPTLFAAL